MRCPELPTLTHLPAHELDPGRSTVDPRHDCETFDFLELGITGNHLGIELTGQGDGEGVGVGQCVVSLDVGGGEGAATVGFDYPHGELVDRRDHFLGGRQSPLALGDVEHFPKVDDRQPRRGLRALAGREDPLDDGSPLLTL